MLKQKKICPYCGQSIMTHRHFFNESLANILLIVAAKFKAFEPFHLQRDLSLSKSEYCNFQKLQYWNLIQKAYKGEKRMGGCWVLTPKVEPLLHEETVISEWVETLNNQVVSKSKNKISLSQAHGHFCIPEVWARRARALMDEVEQQQMTFF